MLNKIIMSLLLVACGMSYAVNNPQITPVKVTKELLNKIATLTPDTSNAYEVEQMIGPASACLPGSIQPSETWTCQWKGDLSSNRMAKTINITFESGMIVHAVGIDDNGNFITGKRKL